MLVSRVHVSYFNARVLKFYAPISVTPFECQKGRSHYLHPSQYFLSTLWNGSRSRLANNSNLEKVTVLDLLSPCFKLINVPARVDESAGQEVGFPRGQPESKVAGEVGLQRASARTVQQSDRIPLTADPRDGKFIEAISFRHRCEDRPWMEAGNTDILVGKLVLKMHQNVYKSRFTRSVTCHARDALVNSGSRDVDDLLLFSQGLWA